MISDRADPPPQDGWTSTDDRGLHVRELAARLGALGVEVHVATRREDPDLPSVERLGARSTVIRMPVGPLGRLDPDRFPQLLAKFSAEVRKVFLRRRDYDLVHSFDWCSGLVGLDLAHRADVPLVHSSLSLGVVRRAALASSSLSRSGGPRNGSEALFAERHRAEVLIGRTADALIASSPADAAAHVRLLHSPRRRIRVIPMGVDPATVPSVPHVEARRRLDLAGHDPVILLVGRSYLTAGVEELLRAVHALRATIGNVRLIVAGAGDLRRRPWAGVNRLLGSLDDAVEVRTAVPYADLGLYYLAADVTVVPARPEPSGLLAVRSLLSGTPVVASDVGGLASIVTHDGVGLIVPPRDPTSLSTAMTQVLVRGRAASSSTCIAHARRYFSAGRWARTVAALYDWTCQAPRRSSPGPTLSWIGGPRSR